LIIVGGTIFGIGVKAIVIPHGLITGGISGVGLLVYYFSKMLTPGTWYFLINIPIFLVGWIYISRRFFLYSLCGMATLSAAMDWIGFTIPIHDPFLAVLAGGTLIGTGAGIILHSLGSAGGNDIIGIILHQKFNIRMGSYFFAFNLIIYAFSFAIINVDLVLYSLAMSFVTSQVMDHVLTIFNQRKMVLIISDLHQTIAAAIHQKIRRGATYLDGSGTFTGRSKKLILTVVHNYQLKRLEKLVYTIDPQAFVIMENTYNVLGKGFSRRKVY
jgi:uncharacterized membrane-anchored protein YitT (DUF2179 family)